MVVGGFAGDERDVLTGCLRRSPLLQLAAAQPPAALILLDLNGFKRINDTIGHDIGDEVLQAVGGRLLLLGESLGAPLIGRLGGDEFAWLVPDGTDPFEIANRAHAALMHPVEIDGMGLPVAAAIGVSINDGAGITELLRRADVAMYRSKWTGERWERWTAGLDESSVRQLEVLAELPGVVDRNELRLVLQPKVHLATREIVGAEALLRWHHPRLGDVSPVEFIPAAEALRQIRVLTRWVIPNAIRTLAELERAGTTLQSMAINLAPVDLLDRDLPVFVETALLSYGVDPERITLEITESALGESWTDIELAVAQLRSLGCRFAIDDFGAGESSISRLRDLAPDELKLDQVFLRGHSRHDTELMRWMVGLGHALEMSVVAEGAETEDDLDLLDHLNCDYVQGFVVSRPVPADALARLVDEWRSAGQPA